MGSEDLDLDMLGRAALCLAKQEGNHVPPNCSLLRREPLSQTPRLPASFPSSIWRQDGNEHPAKTRNDDTVFRILILLIF